MKILFVTGSRGEWGYIRPILEIIDKDPNITYELCVTNMHLLSSFGNSYLEIEKDGFKIHHKIHMSLDGYDHFTQVKSLGIFFSSFSDVVTNSKPDWILLAGDRGEQLIAATVGAYSYIPVAHIQAGEKSGNIDGTSRHAIGKFAHIHFAANKDAYDRLIKLGEEDFRVHNVGAPQIDELVKARITPLEILEEKYSVSLENYFLFVQHPITEEFEQAKEQIEISIEALNSFSEIPIITILPNNDAGSIIITATIHEKANSNFYKFANLTREDYLGFLKYCKVIIGNSSSGLLEAPTLNTPAVNIGRRQDGRVQGINVINCSHNKDEIINAINKAIDPAFKEFLNQKCKNPYGDGNSSEKIVKVLTECEISNKLVVKSLTY
jgi:GDP/UDP-N,N'-diacetylbacillosamine 2-epimerase (hydrolysing)